MIRTEADISISRFAELIGVPRRTYQYRRARWLAGDPIKGPWPAPVVDRIEPEVAKLAEDWPAWGHRKIWAIAFHDGLDVGSQSSVRRALARRGLLQPINYQAEQRQLAQARRDVFVEPVTRRNRVWQADFSEFETSGQGTWQLGGIVDYWSKIALACPVTPTMTAADLIGVFNAAIIAAEEFLAAPLISDCVDDDGVLHKIVIVTDNGGAMKSAAVARWFKARPHFVHVRTKVRSPNTNV